MINRQHIEELLVGQAIFTFALFAWDLIGFFDLSLKVITLPFWLPWVLFILSVPMHCYYRLFVEILWRDAANEEDTAQGTTGWYRGGQILFAVIVVGVFLLQVIPLLAIFVRKLFL